MKRKEPFGKERLVLDAHVVDVLSRRAFVAELKNGHRFTAFTAGTPSAKGAVPEPGGCIRVVFSPFDMTKAGIVRVGASEKDHESAQFGTADV